MRLIVMKNKIKLSECFNKDRSLPIIKSVREDIYQYNKRDIGL